MAAEKDKVLTGVAETLASQSLGDSSLPVNFHGNLAVVNYGAPWCHVCQHMLPTFCNLSNEYASALFIYADVDKCYETTRDVRYTPTFRFYRDGEKVDDFYGAGPQRLRDRIWLHT
ncbi:thioredoxin-like 3-3 isoform X2 [Physcomitrium patens]|uniref:Thioredoxin domain-containing protein n=1 Tax=Physcomitrium patens TaxID=3218 RepID=A0A7I4EMK4_PHYPA|nr:thioredoxin-like 3-3 isoform X2 [Physcomitrium patens]|eukprot:XP_024384420.1 thioredoxin-like 3-3 isoform X2 [Physcomitrella patens]